MKFKIGERVQTLKGWGVIIGERLCASIDVTPQMYHIQLDGGFVRTFHEDHIVDVQGVYDEGYRAGLEAACMALDNARWTELNNCDRLCDDSPKVLAYAETVVNALMQTDTKDEDQARRRPLPPDRLGGALQDTVHTEVGKSRVPKVARINTKEPSE